MFEITFYTVAIFVVALTILNLSLVITLGSKDYSTRTFAFSIFFVAVWVFIRGLFYSVDSTADPLYMFYNDFPPYAIATILNKLSFFIGGIVASGFLIFALSFPDNKRRPGLTIFLILLFFAHSFIYLYDDLFLGLAYHIGGIENWAWQQGPLLWLYDIYFFAPWLVGLYSIAHKASNTFGQTKVQLTYMFWTMYIGLAPVAIFSMILPRFGTFQFEWISTPLMLVWPSIVAFSIMKHKQMNVRAVYAELLIFACILLLFISIFL